MNETKRLILIDGHAVLYRAFHAYPPLTTSKGELINAVYGFTSILLNVINELHPEYLAVTFDRDKPTFRHVEYVGYKAQREEMPTELADQQNRVEEVVTALNIPIYALEGYEADDVIGTLAFQAKSQKLTTNNQLNEVVIVTGDMDALQLVDTDTAVGVRVYVPAKGKIPAKLYDEEGVEGKYGGLEPEQIPDYKGLAGDASDNIPGVKGIGPKATIDLLMAYKTVEEVYKHLGDIKEKFGQRKAELLIAGQENAMLSKKLATIDTDAPIELELKKCEVCDYDKEKVIKLFEELEFKSLIKKLPNDSFEEMVQEALF